MIILVPIRTPVGHPISVHSLCILIPLLPLDACVLFLCTCMYVYARCLWCSVTLSLNAQKKKRRKEKKN